MPLHAPDVALLWPGSRDLEGGWSHCIGAGPVGAQRPQCAPSNEGKDKGIKGKDLISAFPDPDPAWPSPQSRGLSKLGLLGFLPEKGLRALHGLLLVECSCHPVLTYESLLLPTAPRVVSDVYTAGPLASVCNAKSSEYQNTETLSPGLPQTNWVVKLDLKSYESVWVLVYPS